MPGIALRSAFIVGFPGETEDEFEHLLQFIETAGIDRAGCFAYSPVAGATANDIPGMLPPEEREARRARFMEVAEAASVAKLRRRIGDSLGLSGGVHRFDGGVHRIEVYRHLVHLG